MRVRKMVLRLTNYTNIPYFIRVTEGKGMGIEEYDL